MIQTDGNIIKDPAQAADTGTSVAVDTSLFNGILSASENTLQKALDKIDDLTVSAVAGATTQVQYNDGGVLAGDADLLWDKAHNLLYIGRSNAVESGLVVQGNATGYGSALQNIRAYGVSALDIYFSGAHGIYIDSGGTTCLDMRASANNFIDTYSNITGAVGSVFVLGAGGLLTLANFTADAVGHQINITKSRNGAAGQDADVLSVISFKGYNDNATPAIKEFARITTSIIDASDGTEDGLIDFQVMDNGALQSMMTIVPGGAQFPNNPTAPSTILANAVQMWSADYAAGDARLYLMGESDTNKIALGGGKVLFTSAPADHAASGTTHTGICGETLILGDLCYFKSDGKYWKADANQATTMPGVVICIQAGSADDVREFLSRGFFQDASLYNLTVAGLLYASAAATGAIVQTAPVGAGDQVQVLGYAYSADIIFFEPCLVMVEV